tara:strand:+ start:5861 stop:6316 length:456 start_codon:yes stop_codon:yes gene_type:complete
MYKIWLQNIKLSKIKNTNNIFQTLNAVKDSDNMLLLDTGVFKLKDTYKLYKLDIKNLTTNTLDNYCTLENNEKINIVYQTETWNQIKNHDAHYFNSHIINVDRYIIHKNQLVSLVFEYYNNKLHDFYFISKEAPCHEYVKKDISLFLSYIL